MIDFKRLRSLRSEAAVQSIVHREYSGDVESFIDTLDSTLNRLLRTDMKQAAEYVSLTQGLASYLPAQWRARLLSQEARLASWGGDYETAKARYIEALRQFLKDRDFEAVARLRKGLVEVLMYLGEYRSAVEAGQKSLRYFRKRGLQTDEAQMLTNIGNIYHRSDRNKLALQYYTKAREIFVREGGIPLAIVDFNRANIFANLNKLSQAKRLYLDAAAIYKDAGLEIAHAQAQYSVAYLSFLESNYADALAGFEQVYDSFVKLGDRKSAAITLLDLVELEVHLHLFGSAIHLGRQVVNDLRKLKLSYEEGKANFFVATAMIELSEFAQARKFLRRSQSIFDKEENHLWLGMVTLAHAQLALQSARIGEAIRLTRSAESHFTKSGDKRRQNDARLVQVEALTKAQSTPSDFEKTVQALRQSGLVKYQQYRLANTMGEYYLLHARNSKAVQEFQTALMVAEEMLEGLNQDEIRVLFASDITESYNRLAQAYLAEQKQRSALVEVLRGMAVLNVQGRGGGNLRYPGGLQQQIDSLRVQIARLQRIEQPGQRTSTIAGYRDLEQRLWRLQRSARGASIGRQNQAVVSVEQIEMILDKLQEKTLVHFHEYRDQISALIASGSEVRHIRLEIAFSDFQRNLRKIYFLLEQGVVQSGGDESRAMALDHYRRLLYSQLIRPIAPYFGHDEVIMAVDREFLQVPFSILISGDSTPLHDQFDLTLLVNPLDLKRRGTKWASGRACTIVGSDSESLPLVREECEAIHRIYADAKILTGESAGTDAVREALKESGGFVHIAAHAARASENPLFSRILLANGPLFPFEITGRVKAQLVTLSGCQTAAPGLYYGNSFSLAKAFYQAGGRSVLASQWSVADDITLEFMTEFYGYLSASGSVKRSYSKAVEKIRRLTDNPAHWGAFVLLGGMK